MKLSEAIRLGAMLKPQSFGNYRDETGTCAMGAAMDAIGNRGERWKISEYGPVTCPACPLTLVTTGVVYATGAMIVHLNDEHRWTRERIAEWVATVEMAADCVQEEAHGEVHRLS